MADLGAEYSELAAFFDRFAAEDERWRRRNSGYHSWIARLHRFQIPSGREGPRDRVWLGRAPRGSLAFCRRGSRRQCPRWSTSPARDIRACVSSGPPESARARRDFDYIVLSDLLPYVHDLVGLFDRVAAHCHPRTRIVIHSYSRLWRPVIRAAELSASSRRSRFETGSRPR